MNFKEFYLKENEDQINTDNFKKWFGKSKVVDNKGNPLVVYHGSSFDKITKFELGEYPKAIGAIRGYFFTGNKEDAIDYGSNIYPVYLKIEKPFIGDPFEYYAKEHNIEKPTWGSSSEIFSKYKEVNPQNVKNYLIKNGYDGVFGKGGGTNEIIVFEPNQIKSAIKNNGNFNINSDNIYE